ncbi:MAG: hypothetical protein PHZ00_05055, partial [Candidatus Peribacteraceae bacterium]|nr:hypothetical protein [Candidatus Peribacteraceae bacterium]
MVVSIDQKNRSGGEDSLLEKESQENPRNNEQLKRRKAKMLEYWDRYRDVCMQTGFADTANFRETERWIEKTVDTLDSSVQDNIRSREQFFELYGKDVIEEGPMLLRRFNDLLTEAKPYMSGTGKEEWMKRLRDNSSMGFQGKKYWITHQFPKYIERWKKVAEQRDILAKNTEFKAIAKDHPEFSTILNKEAFLNLHYNQRVGLIAKARAFMMAGEKGHSPLYTAAEKKLKSAVFMHVLADHKVGIWLERIFKKNASGKRMEEFVNGSGFNSLGPMIDRWTKVKFRFDMLKDKAGKLDQDSAARGLTIMSEHQFLSMHYTQRKRYVEELDSRINGTGDINQERPVFIQIRHAMDLKDWDEAEELIKKAKLMHLTEKERGRLSSMERFTDEFKPKKKEAANGMDLTQVCRRIDKVVEEIGEHHSEMQPMVKRLLKGPHANRSINQLRWMAYNERWCELHGFYNYDIAKFGASKENEDKTRQLALQGKDVGRHNNLGYTTDGSQNYLRKTEIVRHKATFEHVNVNDGSATQQIAEWCEHEQSPKDLYWRTLCCHSDGEPKPANWHDDWFKRLTELRSLT